MLLRLYRSNQPIVLLFLPLVGLVFWLPSFIDPQPVAPEAAGGPLFDLLVSVTGGIDWVQTLVGYLMVITGAVLITRLFNREGLTEKETYVPALTWMVLWSFSPKLCHLNPVQPAILFIILAVGCLVRTYGRNDVRKPVFDAGFFMGLAILTYPPLWLMLPLVWIALVILRAFNWREWLIPVLGGITPFALAWAIGYLWGTDWLVTDFIHYRTALYPLAGEYIGSVYWVAAFVTFLVTFSGVRIFISSISATTMQQRNVKQVILVFAVFSIITYVNSAFLDQQTYQVSLLFPAMTILIAVYAQEARRKWLATFSYYAWMVLVLWFFYV